MLELVNDFAGTVYKRVNKDHELGNDLDLVNNPSSTSMDRDYGQMVEWKVDF